MILLDVYIKKVFETFMLIYGNKNIEVICDNFAKEEFDCLETIAKRFIKLDSDETSEEDSAREENFKKFLSENL